MIFFETKRFGSLQKPVQHFYLEVQLNYQGAFAYLSLLKVNYLFWQYTVFENHQKMSHLIFVPVLDFNAHFVCNVVK